MSKYNWRPRAVDYEAQRAAMAATGLVVHEHPLKLSDAEEAEAANREQEALEAAKAEEAATVEAAAAAAVVATADAAASADAAPAAPAEPLDPLSAAAAAAPEEKIFDPLSMDAPAETPAETLKATGDENQADAEPEAEEAEEEEEDEATDGEFVEWDERRAHILSTYTTDERISVTAAFIGDGGGAGDKAAPLDQVKARLHELDVDEGRMSSKERQAMTQKEYVRHIETLQSELVRAWDAEEKVKSLKIAIQCAKFLGETSVIKFYPSKFVLVTEILDTFGRLVYNRIRNRAGALDDLARVESAAAYRRAAAAAATAAAADDAARLATEAARETCRNWFFKIASIRELLPRLYVELALLPCYRFLPATRLAVVVRRLARQIRGVGDPLVAVYLRVYLARALRQLRLSPASEEARAAKATLFETFDDYLVTQERMLDPESEAYLDAHRVSFREFTRLFTPALDYLLAAMAHREPPERLHFLLEYYEKSPTTFFLNSLLSSTTPAFIARNALRIVDYIRDRSGQTFSKSLLYKVFGDMLCTEGVEVETAAADAADAAASVGVRRRRVLELAWEEVTKIIDPLKYVNCVASWIGYPLRYLTAADVDAMLGDLLAHVVEERVYEQLQPQLVAVASRVLTHYSADFSRLFALEHFLPLLDLLQDASQVEAGRGLLTAFMQQKALLADPVVVTSMIRLGKTVHDSINTLSFDDDVRRISAALCEFIRKIDFGATDAERQLSFYVECRGAFGQLDDVRRELVLGVASLATRVRRIVNGAHTKKTAAFVRACIAYMYVTIPAMHGVLARLALYRLAAEVALVNGALPQADALIKAAVTLVPEAGEAAAAAVSAAAAADAGADATGVEALRDEAALVVELRALAGLLIAVPGHPDSGAFYLLKGLLGVVNQYAWRAAASKCDVYLSCVAALCALSQRRLPYAAAAVVANDVLYAQSDEYLAEARTIAQSLLDDVLGALAALRQAADAASQRAFVRLSLDLFELTASLAVVDAKSATLAYNLFQVAAKLACDRSDRAALTRTRAARDAVGRDAAAAARDVRGVEQGDAAIVRDLRAKLDEIEI